MTKIFPIGAHTPSHACFAAAAPTIRETPADVWAWRWRTCGKLGARWWCDQRFIDRFDRGATHVSFADYAELRALRIAAAQLAYRSAETVDFDANGSLRQWPFELPPDNPTEIIIASPGAVPYAQPPGSYFDIVF